MQCADERVATLLPFERDAVWLQTTEGIEWSIKDLDERLSDPVLCDDITDFLLREYIYRPAANWSNDRIRAQIDWGFGDA